MAIPDVRRRSMCPRCARPASACICGWVVAVQTQVDLLILQHPMETSNAKGSARLLHLSLAGSTLAEGEAFEPGLLHAMLYANGRMPLLLYPAASGEPAPEAAALPADPAALRLVVLDGTWRKSRKMLHLNPALQCLPRLALTDVPPSHYLIRKAHLADQLSTLEASCHALAQLDAKAAGLRSLLDAFDRFVARFQVTGGRIGT